MALENRCVRTVPESNVFNRFELSLSEKQIPRFVGNVSSWKKKMERLESRAVRPRQARYQAALRPDMNCYDAWSNRTSIRVCCAEFEAAQLESDVKLCRRR